MKNKQLSLKDKQILTNEWAMILSSGLPISEGLYILKDQVMNKDLKEVIESIQKDFLENGDFAGAIKNSKAFDPYMEKMIYIGQQSGHLDEVMQKMVEYYQRQRDMENQVKEALTYPMVLLCIMFIIVALMVFKVLPIFEGLLDNLALSVSDFSFSLMNIGTLFGKISLGVLVVILLGFLLFWLGNQYFKNNSNWNNFLSTFVLTKKLYLKLSLAKFTYAISLFFAGGYPIDEAIDIVSDFIEHPQLKKKILEIKDDLMNGSSFISLLLKKKVYEGYYANMLAIADRTGKQDEMFHRLSDLYQKDVEDATSRFINVIEPSIIAFLSLIVGILLLSIMLPLMSLMVAL